MSNLIRKLSQPLWQMLVMSIAVGSCASRPVNPSVNTSPDKFQKQRSEKEVVAQNFVAASQSIHAGRLAAEAYEKSKNIIDAFVVMSFALAVERPQSTGIAGGGFLLFRHGESGQVMAIDFREMAPGKTKADSYVIDGKVREDLSRLGVRAAGVPGFVAGVLQAHMLFGKTPVRDLLKPVVALARDGFEIDDELAYILYNAREGLKTDEQALSIFFKDGQPLKKGDILKQENLAKTLEIIAKLGRSGFYQGEVAKALVDQQTVGDGFITQADLNRYQVKMRDPVQTVIGDYQLYSMPPPSSGGTAVVQTLNTLEALDIKKTVPGSPEHYHLLAAALQKAFADRARHMGDPDFVNVPYRRLSAKKNAKAIAATIEAGKAKPSRDVDPELWDKIQPPAKESTETTHFSMMDNRGNILASTQTINGFFGAQVMVPGTGLFLNNQMNDFSVAVGVPNQFGAVGSQANEVKARKRPLSSMSPTLVLKKWRPMMALGSTAGTRIISCVSNVLVERLYREQDLYASVTALRTHHQWYPDEIQVEAPGFGSEKSAALKKMGYTINQSDLNCRVSAVERSEDQKLRAVSDPRGYGRPVGVGTPADPVPVADMPALPE